MDALTAEQLKARIDADLQQAYEAGHMPSVYWIDADEAELLNSPVLRHLPTDPLRLDNASPFNLIASDYGNVVMIVRAR